MTPERASPQAVAPSDPRYQTFWRRFLAAYIDSFFLLPFVPVDDWIDAHATKPIAVAWTVAYAFSPLAYSIVLHGCFGQTLGKLLTGVRVLDLSEAKLSMRQAVLRDSVPLVFIAAALGMFAWGVNLGPGGTTGRLVAIGFFAWAGLELASMLLSERRRAVHDLIAGSVVVCDAESRPARGYSFVALVVGAIGVHAFLELLENLGVSVGRFEYLHRAVLWFVTPAAAALGVRELIAARRRRGE